MRFACLILNLCIKSSHMWDKFLSYLLFWKKPNPDTPSSFNLKMMHGINRISIYMFLFALIVILVRLVRSL